MMWGLRAAACLLAAGVLASCGGGDGDDSSPSTAAADGPVEGTLSVWTTNSLPSQNEWWDQFAKDFEKKYPQATIEVSGFGAAEQIQKVLSAFSAGDEPDVFAVPNGELLNKYVREGRMAPIGEVVDMGWATPASVEAYSTEDGVYGLPLNGYGIAMWVNESLLAEHGVEVPTTWDQLLDVCSTLSSEGVAPIALGMGGQDVWTAQLWYDSLLFQQSGNPNVTMDATYGEGGASWGDPEFVKAAAAFRELVDADCFQKGFTGTNSVQATSLFQRGEAGAIVQGTWIGAELTSSKDQQIVVTPIPDAPGAPHSTASFEGTSGGFDGVAVTKKGLDRNPALVKAFLEALVEAAEDYATATDQVTVVRDAKPTGNPLQDAVTEFVSSAEQVMPPTDLSTPSVIHDDYFQNLAGVATGDLTPEAFAQNMTDAVAADQSRLPERGGS